MVNCIVEQLCLRILFSATSWVHFKFDLKVITKNATKLSKVESKSETLNELLQLKADRKFTKNVYNYCIVKHILGIPSVLFYSAALICRVHWIFCTNAIFTVPAIWFEILQPCAIENLHLGVAKQVSVAVGWVKIKILLMAQLKGLTAKFKLM